MGEIIKKILFFNLIVVLIVVFLDQLCKILILDKVGIGQTSPFIHSLIQFSVVQNTGGAFSILKQFPLFFQIIGVINVIIFSYLTFCPTVTFNNLVKTGCALILGGTVGNLTDRFLRGGVVDYLDLQFINFAVFNLADVFIDFGVVMILIGWLWKNKSH